MSSDAQGLRRWLCEQVDVPSRGTIVDLGCGRGDDIFSLAQSHPAAAFVGIDRSDWKRAACEWDVPPNLHFVLADLSRGIPLQGGSVDVLLSVNLLECLADQAAFLGECARVLRPGGQIVMAHFDWDTQTFDRADRDLVRRLIHSFSDWQQEWMESLDPWAGRRLRRLFAECGLFTGEIRAHTLISTSFEPGSYGRRQAESFEALVKRGRISREDYDRFMEAQFAAASAEAFMFSVTMYAFVGRKAWIGGFD